ncbi:nitrogen assimilation transcription factor nira protein [Diplodia corticola]|uniref:Nitrogen assimilation transcription factor nira protein n=1 Tax=Diplodia corticola TaxID=236234 RepID=A0A1J9SEA7_9PEZI|nr:nitrogen assimilation transcription factor nira protein [Diplodia corticola]OJD38759.1 nitrogen assimilation transcription factor nira protein [Diplodia corticola]
MESTDPPAESQGLSDSGSALPPRQQPSKRTKVTLVACQSCQHRKHKCDGARPICSQCRARKRPDCTYDAAGDQRRTSALKQRIRDLERQTRDLQDVLVGIGASADSEAAASTARQLADGGFQHTAEVAQAFRMDETKDKTHAESWKNITVRPAGYGEAADDAMFEASPSSAETTDSVDPEGIVDPRLQYWPIDTAEGTAPFGLHEDDNTVMQTLEMYWPGSVGAEAGFLDQTQAQWDGQAGASTWASGPSGGAAPDAAPPGTGQAGARRRG